jgi:hypothetical protein
MNLLLQVPAQFRLVEGLAVLDEDVHDRLAVAVRGAYGLTHRGMAVESDHAGVPHKLGAIHSVDPDSLLVTWPLA